MKRGDSQLGFPGTLYSDTKANIEALAGVPEGAEAYATDTNESGTYDGAAWTWGGGGNALSTLLTGLSLVTNQVIDATDTILQAFGYLQAQITYILGTRREKLTAARTYYVGFDVGTVTMTIASPAVVTKTAHGLENDDPIIFRTTGALPTGIVAGTTYFVKNKAANTFEVSATVGGASINTSGTQSGTHSAQTGNNNNDGLSTGRAGAFLTIQNAVDVAATIDSSIYDITIQLADGLYTTAVVGKNVVGAGNVIIQGNSGTPANVLVHTTSANAFTFDSVLTKYILKDVEIRTTTSGSAINATKGSVVDFTNLRFGTCATDHIRSSFFAVVTAIGNYAVTGGAGRHLVAFVLGLIVTSTRTITYSNSPAFSTANFVCQDLSECYVFSMTFTNGATVTGKRYDMSTNAVINTNGGGANYIPGNAVGTSATGAQYI